MTSQRLGARLIPGAAATGIPLLIANPDFAIEPLEWLEWLVFPIFVTGAAWAIGALAAGPLGVPSVRSRVGAALAAWVVLLSVAGAAADGLRGALTVAACGVSAAAVALALRNRVSGFARSMGVVAVIWIAAFALASRFAPAAPAPDRPLVVVGLDGASWDLTDRFRAEGRLPTFDRLARTGTRGDLEAIPPLLSPSLWTTIASGLPPAAHGVRDFWTSSRHVRGKRLWEIADENGLESGAFGYLVTWPPRKQTGFLVPGFLAGDTQTVPPRLAFIKELEVGQRERSPISAVQMLRLAFAALEHGGTLGTLHTALASWSGLSGELDRELSQRLTLLAVRVDAFCHMLRDHRPELALFYHDQIDAVGHRYFRYFAPQAFPDVRPEEAELWGEAIPRMYEASDRILSRISGCVPGDVNLMVVSNHGQRPATRHSRPELMVKSSRLLHLLGLEENVRSANVGGHVYLNSTPAGTPIAPALERLRSVVTEPDGVSLFRIDVHDRESALLQASVGEIRGTARVGEHSVALTELLAAEGEISGARTETGMLLMAGPDIAAGARLAEASLLDIAPTALALLGLPTARDMPGGALVDALRGPARVPLPRIESYGLPEDFAEAPR